VKRVARQFDLVPHSDYVAHINGSMDQSLGMNVVQCRQESSEDFERLGPGKWTVVEARMKGLVGVLKNGEEDRFTVAIGAPGIE